MDPAVATTATPAPVVFRDGLGERRRLADPTGKDPIDVLCLSTELTAVASFEFALRERVSRLVGFRHPYFAYVRSVDRLGKGDTGLSKGTAKLAVVSDATPGTRLSEILANAERHQLPLDIGAALCLIRQLVPAIATLHEHQRDAAHGALAPERIIMTPRSRLVVAEYAMGAALEQLRFSHQRYWKDLRIALPRAAGLPHFDHRVDVAQIGVVALSLILGRPLHDDDYPAHVSELVSSAWAVSAGGDLEPLTHGLRTWLTRALQLDLRTAFTSVAEAGAELDKVLASESDYMADPASLEAFLTRYRATVEQPAEPPKAAAAPPASTPPPASAPIPVAVTPPIPVAPRVSSPPPTVATPPIAAPPRAPAPTRVPDPPRAPEPPRAAEPQRPVEPPRQPVTAAAPPPPAQTKVEPVVPPPPAPAKPAAAPALPPMAARTQDLVLPSHQDDDMDEEEEPVPPSRPWRLIAAAVLIGVAGLGFFAWRYFGGPASSHAARGTLIVTTNPAGANVAVDGQSRGVTPVTLDLAPGPHLLELRGAGQPRTIPVTVPEGTQVSQYIELASGSSNGNLQVRTEPAGAVVTVDGASRGTSPLTVADLAPGEHSVVLTSDAGSVTHTVTVEAGSTASLVVPLAVREAAPANGWVSVSSPVELQLYENGRLLGTSHMDRITVAPGSHQVELVNEALGYRVTRTIQVPAGKVAPMAIKLPMGTIALNAVPWADVWIDGEKVGETPIGNLQTSIGPHEIIFRHPELGEQRQAVTVTLAAPARVSVDMRKK